VFDEATRQQYAGVLTPLNTDDYAALKALYQSTDGANWTDNTGWKDWDFNSTTPPDIDLVMTWKGVELWMAGEQRVASLNLHLNNLSGTIPTEIGNLSSLSFLALGANNLNGAIPTELGSLSNLSYLNLGENDLSGSIPSELGSLTNLFFLNLGSNQLSGTIPSELGNLDGLKELYLDTNALGGDVPQSIISKLTNQIINYNLNNSPYVDDVTDKTIEVGSSLTLNLSVSDIDAGGNEDFNNLTLSFASDNPTLIDSNSISISGTGSDRTVTFTPSSGQAGSAIITMTLQDGNGETAVKTFVLNVQEEMLNADDYAALKALYQNTEGANWTDNTGWKDWDFSSTTPPPLRLVSQWKGVELDGDRVIGLELHVNNLNGTIPTELGNLSGLVYLDLGANSLSGTIPTSLGSLSKLTDLNLGENQLTGSIPSELGNLSSLNNLNLGSNQLSGTIPLELGNLNLRTLYLDTNALGGEVPQSVISKLDKVSAYNLNNSPYVDDVTEKTVAEGSSLTLNLSVSDIDQGGNEDPNKLTLSFASDNPTLIDSNSISISGTGSDRTVTFTPSSGQIGSAIITMTLTDMSGESFAKTFKLNVEQRLDAQDYAALKALYLSTGGINWGNNSGWKDWDFSSDAPPPLSVVRQWSGVTLDGDRVSELQLSDNRLSGTIPTELSNLSKLQRLDFYRNTLTGAIPIELSNLSNLTYFDLGYNQLSGGIPSELGNLSNLEKLYLDGNQLTGSIPTEFGNLSKLQGLYLNDNQLSGGLPSALGNLSNLKDLKLQNNKLSGSIPGEFGNLASLALLDLANNALSGNIPTQLGSLSKLEELYLFSNQLSGSIPAELGNLSKLVSLDLHGLSLNGSIPAELGNLSNLTKLVLEGTQLSGSIPTTLGNLSNLTELSLENAQLSGSIPAELGNLTNLKYLFLYNNQLSGSIPTELGNLTNIRTLFLYNNQLSGQIPQSLADRIANGLGRYNFDNSPYVNAIADQFTYHNQPLTLNVSVSDIDTGGNDSNDNLTLSFTSSNTSLINSSNFLVTGTGSDRTITITPISGQSGSATITMTLTDMSGEQTVKTFALTVGEQLLNTQDYAALKALYQSTGGANWTDNTGWKDWDFSSNTPPALSVVSQWKGMRLTGDRVTELDLNANNLSGTIPSALGNLSELKGLYLNGNQLSGSIPAELGNLSHLESITLYGNQLSGSIPTTFGNLNTLTYLDLSNNQLSGAIPVELGKLSSLTLLALSINQLTGTIPTQLSNLTNLDTLDLSQNQLTGTIPSELSTLSALKTLSLSFNQLSGTVPTQLGNLSNLQSLFLQGNQLTGSIPTSLGNLTKLQILNLSTNQLSGNIPTELGKLSQLKRLRLNTNELSGSIPIELGNLNNLQMLLLNSNQLSGDVPQAIANKLGTSITTYNLDNLPTIITLANQSTTTDKPLTLNLSVSDLDTAGNGDPALLTLTAVSDNTALISASGISVSGTGNDRVLILTPNGGHTGTATITLTLQDTNGEKIEKSFTIQVGLGSTVTSLFDSTHSEFVISNDLLQLNEETLTAGNLFHGRNGTSKADKLRGKGRNDAIFGRGKDDLLSGQSGNDFLAGGKGNDVVSGDAGNDLLFGGKANDTLVGGGGNDILIGGVGSDRITTGTGNDQVGFTSLTSSKTADTITDFNVKADMLVLSAQAFGGSLVVGQTIRAEEFYIGTKAIGAEDRFIYNRKTGDLLFDADGSGAGKAIAFAHLKAGLNLSNQNILVV
jgi:Leucine-rich repeat (LRR) protein